MTTLTSPANPAVKAARKLGRRHGRARAGDEFLVEGPQAVAEAGAFLRRLFVVDDGEQRFTALIAAAVDRGVEVLHVTPAVLAEIATTVSPQGLIGVAVLPAAALDDVVVDAQMLVVLHQVRDPGNAGTALRSADAAGADAFLLTRGSVDPRNPKAVRASVGSLFHLPVVDDVAFSAIAGACRERGIRLVGAAADGARVHTDADLSGPVALVFGNEAHGLPADVRATCDEIVRIPLHARPRAGFTGTAESLNLAATVAVLTYESTRQRGADAPPTPRTR